MIDRRTALKHLGGAASALWLSETLSTEISAAAQAPASSPAPAAAQTPTGPFKLPALPYAYDALEPTSTRRRCICITTSTTKPM